MQYIISYHAKRSVKPPVLRIYFLGPSTSIITSACKMRILPKIENVRNNNIYCQW